MPTKRPAGQPTRRQPTTKAVAKRRKKRRGPRTLSAAHKRALADGRSMSSTVDRYLSVINTPKPRGRKVSKSVLEQRLAAARARVRTSTGLDKVLAAQESRNDQFWDVGGCQEFGSRVRQDRPEVQ